VNKAGYNLVAYLSCGSGPVLLFGRLGCSVSFAVELSTLCGGLSLLWLNGRVCIFVMCEEVGKGEGWPLALCSLFLYGIIAILPPMSRYRSNTLAYCFLPDR